MLSLDYKIEKKLLLRNRLNLVFNLMRFFEDHLLTEIMFDYKNKYNIPSLNICMYILYQTEYESICIL